MSERSESGGAIVAIVAILIVVLLLATGLGGYVFVARQQAMRAVEAELQARMAAEQARAIAEVHLAQSKAADKPSQLPVDQSLRPAIEAILTAQANEWNAGKVDEFMEHYWKSDELTF